MMRDAQRIDHMLGFVRRCLEILDGVDEGMYLSSLDKQEQVELNMLHLGEAAARVSDEVKESHPDLPWHEMVGMRNVLTHEYFPLVFPLLRNRNKGIIADLWGKVFICKAEKKRGSFVLLDK